VNLSPDGLSPPDDPSSTATAGELPSNDAFCRRGRDVSRGYSFFFRSKEDHAALGSFLPSLGLELQAVIRSW